MVIVPRAVRKRGIHGRDDAVPAMYEPFEAVTSLFATRPQIASSVTRPTHVLFAEGLRGLFETPPRRG